MKPIFHLLPIVTLLAGLFLTAGCRSKPISTADTTLVIWHWMTDREPAFLELAKRYEEKTGVEVKFQLYAPTANYEQKVRVGAQTQSLPDIFGILAKSEDVANFIEAGHVEKLTPYFGEGKGSWAESFFEEALKTTAFVEGNPYNVPPGYYGVPMDVSTIPMIYNRKLFKSAGLDPDSPPQTWDEFIETGKKLKASGVTGFVSGWSEMWLIYSLFTNLAHNLMGAEKVMDTFRGNVPYTDPDWVKVFGAFEELRRAGFLDPSIVTYQNKSAEQTFASERAGMTFNGSWSVNVFNTMNPDLDFAPFQIPTLNPNNPGVCWGGAGTIFNVNGRSPNKDEAVNFLRWLTQPEQAAFLVSETKNLPSIKDLEGSITPILSSFASLMENSIHPNRFPVNEDPKVQEAITKGIQSILIGSRTAAQIAASVQAAKGKAPKVGT